MSIPSLQVSHPAALGSVAPELPPLLPLPDRDSQVTAAATAPAVSESLVDYDASAFKLHWHPGLRTSASAPSPPQPYFVPWVSRGREEKLLVLGLSWAVGRTIMRTDSEPGRSRLGSKSPGRYHQPKAGPAQEGRPESKRGDRSAGLSRRRRRCSRAVRRGGAGRQPTEDSELRKAPQCGARRCAAPTAAPLLGRCPPLLSSVAAAVASGPNYAGLQT